MRFFHHPHSNTISTRCFLGLVLKLVSLGGGVFFFYDLMTVFKYFKVPKYLWVAYRVREAVLTAVVLQSQSNNFHCGQNTFHRGQNTFHCGQDRFHCSQFSIAVRVVLTAMKNEFDRGEKWSNHRQAYKGVKSCFKCSYRNFWPRSNLL